MDFAHALGQMTFFAFQATRALPGATLRLKSWLRQLHLMLLGCLPLAAAAGMALGFVVWLHLHQVLARFEAAAFLPQALALGVVLEFAPTGAGLILAGRAGASLGAELASMRLTEQIDVLEVFGLSPLRILVAPRILACMLALPILTVFIVYLALGSSFAAEALGGSMTWTQYRTEFLRGLRLEDVLPAIAKTVVFGYLTGLAGCYFGLTAHGGTEGVGRAATQGVVGATLLVLAANVVLVRLIQLLH